jgi:hypothetical protein
MDIARSRFYISQARKFLFFSRTSRKLRIFVLRREMVQTNCTTPPRTKGGKCLQNSKRTLTLLRKIRSAKYLPLQSPLELLAY